MPALFNHALELSPQRLQPLDPVHHLFKLNPSDQIGGFTSLVRIVGQFE